MTVHVRPSGVRISRFRGIRELELELHEGTSTYLIGPNNSGKSTVLNAVALALKSGGFRTFTPTRYDYFRAADGTHADTFAVSVDLKTDGDAPAVQGVGAPVEVHGIQVVGRTQRSRLVHRHVLLDEKGAPITLSTRTPLKGEANAKYKDQGLGYSKHYARAEEISEYLPELWHFTPENLDRSLYHWRTGPLRRLARLLSRNFFEEEWELATDGGPRRMPSSLHKAYGFLQQAVAEFPFWKDDLRPRLEETLSRYVGRSAVMQLRPTVEALEDWLTDQLAVAFAVEAGGAITPLETMGQGWQSLVRIAALDVLRQYPDESKDSVILLFEEPETYLHPHLARKLRDVLDGLSDLGWTVLCSTHAPEFVSFRNNQCVARLRRSGEAVEAGVLLARTIPESARFQELLDERGNHEMLFGSRVVLCEGKDDVLALRHYLSVAEADLDGRSVSLVDLGGVLTLPAYARMAADLGIPWCGLTDEDKSEDGTLKPNTVKARTQLTEIAGESDLMPIWSVSLEHALGLPESAKASPEWQSENLLPLGRAEIDSRYPEFSATCNEVLRWVTAEGGSD